MLAVKVVEGAAHSIKAGIRINQYSLRGVKLAACFELPAEVFRIDSHYGTYIIELVFLNISYKVSAVDKVDAINTARIPAGIVIEKGNKWMLLMACFSAVRIHTLSSHMKRATVYVAFAGP